MKIIIIITYLLQLSFHSVAAVLTLVQTKQIKIYLTAMGLTPGGSSTVHIYTHIHKQ